MSYARWGCDNSDVYVYADVKGGFTCMWDQFTINLQTGNEMIEYLMVLRQLGQVVPDYTIESLKGQTNKKVVEMNNCPDCGKPADDLHTCIEYERNRADNLQKQVELLYTEVQALKKRIVELEHTAAGR